MDRPLDPDFRRWQIIKRLGLSVLVIGLLVVAVMTVPAWITPSISRSRIRTALVDRGPIEATITASGTVVPEFEQVVSSPISARVIKILNRPGTLLKRGDPILELDVSELVLARERLREQLALKENEQTQLQLELENALITLQGQWEIKRLEVLSWELKYKQNAQLHQRGLVSESDLRQSELQKDRAEIELRQLDESKRNAEKTTQVRLNGLAREMMIAKKELDDIQRQLELSTTRSEWDGVLTWVTPEEGATIQKGDVLARIANLTSFRINATVSDVHATRLAVGLPVKVKVNDTYLSGTITTVLPTIENGIVTFFVGLDNKFDEILRSNLRVDVYVVTDRADQTLRVKKGPFVNGAGEQEVFVIRGESALRTHVRLGISSFEEYEVADGLLEGDEVIISDMREYLHLKEIYLK